MDTRNSESRRQSGASKRKGNPRKTAYFNIGVKLFKVNVKTLNSIKALQVSTKLCIPKLPFSRVVREILMERASIDMRLERKALDALQEAAEIYLTVLFEDSNRCAYHAKRITLKPQDMRLVLDIKGVVDPGFLNS